MNPEPSTDTAFLRACWHGGRDLEGGVDVPNALVVDTEDGKVLGLHRIYIGFVGDG
jgi:hypothetical protein